MEMVMRVLLNQSILLHCRVSSFFFFFLFFFLISRNAPKIKWCARQLKICAQMSLFVGASVIFRLYSANIQRIEFQFLHSLLSGVPSHFTNGAYRARILSIYVAALRSFPRFMHIRKVHSAYKCASRATWKTAFKGDGSEGRGASRPSRHFSR